MSTRWLQLSRPYGGLALAVQEYVIINIDNVASVNRGTTDTMAVVRMVDGNRYTITDNEMTAITGKRPQGE